MGTLEFKNKNTPWPSLYIFQNFTENEWSKYKMSVNNAVNVVIHTFQLNCCSKNCVAECKMKRNCLVFFFVTCTHVRKLMRPILNWYLLFHSAASLAGGAWLMLFRFDVHACIQTRYLLEVPLCKKNSFNFKINIHCTSFILFLINKIFKSCL